MKGYELLSNAYGGRIAIATALLLGMLAATNTRGGTIGSLSTLSDTELAQPLSLSQAISVPQAIEEPPLLPPPVLPAPGEPPVAAPPGPAAGEAQKLGPAPEDNRLLFLRQATVLLNPGQAQFDWGFDYAWQERQYPTVLGDATLDSLRVRQRRLVAPLAIRYGVSERLQAFAELPVGLGSLERETVLGRQTHTEFNIGDLSGGFNYLIHRGDEACPDVIFNFRFVAPTGPASIGTIDSLSSLGAGFWSLAGDVLCVKTYDPVVVLYGVGYRHYFEHEFFGRQIAPGEELYYRFGAGFAVNDRITFSTIVLGSYISDFRVDGADRFDTSLEPICVRLALTANIDRCRILEPFVRIGITPDAPNAELGITVTRTF